MNEVSYFEIETYGKSAEYCGKKATKGRGVRVVGRLKQDTWKDENEKFHNKVYVIAEHLEFKPVYAKEADTTNTETVELSSTTPVEEKQNVVEKEPVPAEAVAF